MILAIFDLDNTLLGGDSDHLWGEFLVEQGIVEASSYKKANDQFYQDYLDGKLDMHAYTRFAVEPLTKIAKEERERLHKEFLLNKIQAIMQPKAQALIEKHKNNGDILLIITATNDFITMPIAEKLGIDNILATNAEIVDGQYTGAIAGIPCYQEGKIKRLELWLEEQSMSYNDFEHVYFYSDSVNDIPLLAKVSKPVAVDPDEKLRLHAEKHNWPVISLR